MFFNNVPRSVSEQKHFLCGQRHMNPVAKNSILTTLAPLPPIVHEAPRDHMTVAPKVFHLMLGQELATFLDADRNSDLRLRLNDFSVALKNQIKRCARIIFVIAKVEQRWPDPSLK